MSVVIDKAAAAIPAASDFGAGRLLRPTEPKYLEILYFLWNEAAVLDNEDLVGWRELLDPDITYRMPVCVTRKRNSGESYETETMHFDEDFFSISFRVKRFLETQAWAADPPTRARRFVTGVRAWESHGRETYDVTSSILLIRSSDDDFRTDLVTAQRFDRIRFTEAAEAKLLARKILADQTTIGTHNLAVFL